MAGLKSFFACFMLAVSVLNAAEPLLSREIQLTGDLTLARIIWEAERQLSLKIVLPRSPDNKSSQYYNQVIRLETLMGAIRQYYEQDGQQVSWTVEGSTIRVMEKANPPPPPVQPSEPEISREHELQTLPQPAARKVEEDTPSMWRKVPVQDLESPRSGQAKPFVVDLERRQGGVPRENLLAQPAQPALKGPVPRLPAGGAEEPKPPIVVTPYPENAVGFINDAPSIVQQNSHEKFIEWQVRMKGALDARNTEVLRAEQRELEKRLAWLKNHLR